MTDTKQHSDGAIRAAKEINEITMRRTYAGDHTISWNEQFENALAEVIDRETKCKELVGLAHDVLESADRPPENPKFVYVDDELLGKLAEAIEYSLANNVKENSNG